MKILNSTFTFKIYSKYFFYSALLLNFFLLIFFINNYYIDGYNIRQAQTAMMAENIFIDGIKFLPTRLNFFAPFDGHTVLEFPFIHAVTAFFYSYLGIYEYIGRALNLIFHLINGLLIYAIFKKFFNSDYSKLATIIYLFSSIIFYLSHAFMPETSMMTFYLLSLFLYLSYRNKNKFSFKNFFFIVSISIAPLLKPLAGIIYFPILLDLLKQKSYTKLIIIFICAIPFLIWTYYASTINSDFSNTGNNWGQWGHVISKIGYFEILLSFSFYKKIIFNLFFLVLTPGLMIFSIIKFIKFNRYHWFDNFCFNWIIVNFIFILIFAGPNLNHPYYLIYIIPPLIYFSVSFIENSNILPLNSLISKIIIIFHISFGTLIFLYGTNDTKRIYNFENYLSAIKEIKYQIGPHKDSFMLIDSRGMTNGVFDYYSKVYTREFNPRNQSNVEDSLKNLISKGARLILIVKSSYGDSIDWLNKNSEYSNFLKNNSTKIYDSDNYLIFKFINNNNLD